MKNLVLDCGEECSFRLADGRTIRSLRELNNRLNDMEENTFNHHVNVERNDFAAWVKDVLKDEKLAEDLSKTKDRTVTKLIIANRILDLINEMTE